MQPSTKKRPDDFMIITSREKHLNQDNKLWCTIL
ncbi:hypothetical protein A2U01_0081748, partial [Trifolium medium]|nr:hypothetical protein [Trifolium medium]